ncbi:hypothetical protein [Mucilaginibacter ginkgonis]|uniref:Lipoprotein n=1 Tax=Mucilaginibacter ginkgonis TaxID=2682091 RepID=A0A6I4HYU1_9SPHI|nr:hypothetical protein [Mucilaginibacter ginkgonis]QQL49630.1 hypothetical protein GO620_015875 [Mucilaginibacter ginkgonis]
MKKLLIIASAVITITATACNGSNKTGGATRDSSASHGYSGPSNNGGAGGSSASIGASSVGTDTSKTGKSTTEPTVDTAVKKKP